MKNRFSETKRPTIADIARRAGVTKSSVSFALNGRHGVSEETRRRILEIARELGWQRSSAASALSHGRAGAVGLVLDRPGPGDEASVMRFVSGVERELSKHDVPLLLRLVDDPQDHLAIHGEWWAQRRVDGVILTALTTDDPRPAALRQMGLPAITTAPPNQASRTPRAHHPEQPQPTDPTTQVRTEAVPLSEGVARTEAEGPSGRTAGMEDEGRRGRLAGGDTAGPPQRTTGTEAGGLSGRTAGTGSEGRRGRPAGGEIAGPPRGMTGTEAAGPPGGTGSAVAEGVSGPVAFAVGEDEEAAMQGVLAYLVALGHREVARVAGDARLASTAARDAGLARPTVRDAGQAASGEGRMGTAVSGAGRAGTTVRNADLAGTAVSYAGRTRTAVRDADRPHARIIHTDGTPDQATTATRRLLTAPEPPTAIIYDTDAMAVAGLAVAREMGVNVPADLSIVAWGDTTLAKLSHPPLTVVAADPEALGTRAAKLLLAVIAGQHPTQLPPPVPELIPRGTTSRLEKNRFTS